jgi:hypothetical protein
MTRGVGVIGGAVIVAATAMSWILLVEPERWRGLRFLVLVAGSVGLLLFLSALARVVRQRGNRSVTIRQQALAIRAHWLLGVVVLLCLASLGLATAAGFAGPGAPVEELGVRYFDNHGTRTLATATEWMRAHAWLYLFGCVFAAMAAYNATCLFGILDGTAVSAHGEN